ncbi:hypothetical protein EX87_06365 [Brevibacillus laterosporus]|uniref:Uncharacterized protein n=1 Tax=Brevibacillus laterosporus TaxID=1465 RepID=A0A0F6XZ81_BRELA|nr:hypothetical protein EX87_06365 [Brevibacillus laterosporus]
MEEQVLSFSKYSLNYKLHWILLHKTFGFYLVISCAVYHLQLAKEIYDNRVALATPSIIEKQSCVVPLLMDHH